MYAAKSRQSFMHASVEDQTEERLALQNGLCCALGLNSGKAAYAALGS
jgi:hypothetical protein